MMNKQSVRTGKLIIVAAIIGALVLAALPILLRAQGELTIRWGNVSSSYGISSGAGYRIAGTSGEVDSGPPLTGGGFQATGGFWSGVDQPPPVAETPSFDFRLFVPVSVGKSPG